MILVALGANLPSRYGAPAETLRAAVRALEAYGLNITARSRIWLTAPVPVSDQPYYHNAVIALETTQSPISLLMTLQAIETDFGRVRTIRNAPRILDLDVIAYRDEILEQDQTLIVPHPRMHERAFVLLPLRDIAPDWVHPALNLSVTDMLGTVPADQYAVPMEGEDGLL